MTRRPPARPRAAVAPRRYPQVDPRAAGICDLGVLALPGSARVGEALLRARQRQAAIVAAGEVWVLREDLARASVLGLEGLAARSLARPLPVVAATESEVTVRRQLAAGWPAVVVADRRGAVVGAVGAPPAAVVAILGRRFRDRLGARVLDVLAAVQSAAAGRGMQAFLVGGLVRDLVAGLATERRDLDVAVEGDGVAVARAMAMALGAPEGAVTEHERFGTASVTVHDMRVDVATARAERYERPGALPRVLPAPIGEDLGRRDFAVNAMAVELASGDLGLLDPFNGRRDLQRRRLRVLHPLSFVEDPTRIFRAARYAARLGFQVDRWTAAAQRLALALGEYPALSGQRLAAELELILADARPEVALRRLGARGALRLLDPRYRFSRPTADRLGRLRPTLRRVAAAGLRVAPLELGLVALLADQAELVAHAALGRLGLAGEPRARVERALAAPPAAVPPRPPRARAARLRALGDLGLAAWWLRGDAAARRAADWYVTTARPVRPVLRGDDLLALGVPAGPELARVLEALRDARLDGAVADRDGEAAYVRDWVEQSKEG